MHAINNRITHTITKAAIREWNNFETSENEVKLRSLKDCHVVVMDNEH